MFWMIGTHPRPFDALHVIKRCNGAHFRTDLFTKEFPELFAQSVHRETFSR